MATVIERVAEAADAGSVEVLVCERCVDAFWPLLVDSVPASSSTCGICGSALVLASELLR